MEARMDRKIQQAAGNNDQLALNVTGQVSGLTLG